MSKPKVEELIASTINELLNLSGDEVNAFLSTMAATCILLMRDIAGDAEVDKFLTDAIMSKDSFNNIDRKSMN